MKLYVFPGNIEEDILQVGAQAIPYMRTSQFSELVKDSEKMLLQLINCTNGRILFYTASGTGAMDAVVSNYVTTKSKAFVIAGGSFG
ncbi:MAG: alanine--glyoxylate aminotransferase family protein, partial [Bacteroides sp.]